ncbi:MAG TPA: ABC transporter ATP-binding protein, partial [Clostridia bacterium]|nr:ABC transporter ATP-binding protein [Clostridia bacterium]
MLECRNLSFSYGEKPVLQNISLAFEDGRVSCLIGPNGSGKSTLLSLLSGLRKPDAGQVLLDKKPVCEYGRKERARRISYVQQSAPTDFDFTVADVVMMGRYPYLPPLGGIGTRDKECADKAMEKMGLLALAARPATALSGGEWQRVMIARAICQDTKTILLDEPVASLDLSYQLETLKYVRELAGEGRCVVVVLHALALALHYSDELFLIKDGALFAAGAPEKVLSAPN